MGSRAGHCDHDRGDRPRQGPALRSPTAADERLDPRACKHLPADRRVAVVTFELALLLAGALLIMSPRPLLAAAAYVVIASIATASILPAAVGSPFALALLSGSAFLKLVVAP